MSLPSRILRYLACFFLVLGLASGLVWLATQPGRLAPSPASRLTGKTAFYLAHRANYDLVFVGDSRTYCAMQPEILDPLLGTRSFNLAHWAHWLPTQYPHFQAIAGQIPKGATLVYSVGENNFTRLPIHDTYPIGLANVPRYRSLGIPLAEMADNLMAFNPLTYLYAKRVSALEQVRDILARPVAPPLARGLGQPGPAALVREYAARPGVLRVEVQAPEGRPVAVSQFMAGGGYLLEELDPGHFRARQVHTPDTGPVRAYAPDPTRWALFLACLDLLHDHGVRVVVNILEEAPHKYPSPDALAQVRAFMDSRVRQEAEQRGFVYLRPNLDALTDADYFDYDHLNARGVETYSRLFAKALAPHLKSLGRP